MKFSLENDGGSYTIRSYDHGEVVINEHHHTKSIIVMPKQIMDDWPPQKFEDLAEAHFETLCALEPQLVILGTGETQQFPHPEIYSSLIQKGIGIEVMATPAACRTYNILVSEGRKVAAALLLG